MFAQVYCERMKKVESAVEYESVIIAAFFTFDIKPTIQPNHVSELYS